MEYAFVQAAVGSFADGTATIALSGAVSVGDLLVVSFWTGTETAGAISDTLANGWSLLGTEYADGSNAYENVYVSTVTNGGDSDVITISGLGANAVSVAAEFSAGGAPIALVGSPVTSAYEGSAVDSGTIAVSGSNALVVTGVAWGTNGYTLSSDFSIAENVAPLGDGYHMGQAILYDLDATTSTSITGTLSGSGNVWTTVSGAFAAPGGSFACSPSTIPSDHAGQITLDLAGTSTYWSSGTTFSVSGVDDVTLLSQSVTSSTATVLVVTTGSGTGTLTISDGSVSTTISVAAATAPPSFMVPPTFCGQSLLGDPAALIAIAITGRPPSVIDDFLGLTPGTTVYGAPAGGSLVGVTGIFQGTSSAAVTASYESLAAFAGIAGPFLMPGGVGGTGGRWFYDRCYFGPGDIVAGTVSGSGASYWLGFSLMLRVPEPAS